VIKRLLVANRGEIAIRIMATAAVLGIETVAVYPADDVASAHVSRAGSAVGLPGAGPAAYLDVDAIVAAAAGTGCDMLHPGYGFLSERPELARSCAQAGVRFAGPDADALALFGDKTAARARARELGVPVLAATDAAPVPDGPALEQALDLLREHGAVMVKAAAGGGGRGLRPVTREADLAGAMRRCASEAASAFGDGTVYAEQLLAPARHIEIQVIGDGTGAVAVLGDRDCSLQRRRQKLVEIAPAPIGDGLRARLSKAAVALARSAQYAGLATVEFLVQDDTVAFLEVNPRIQVEHTVTEQVTGLDLVELALRVADGARLADLRLGDAPAGQVAPRGVAIQARVNAETLNPDGTVQPGAGTLTRFQPPAGRGVRVDTAAYPGWTVSPRYDSLLAKLITDGVTLEEAARRAVLALAEFDLAGVPVNVALLQALLQAPGLGTLDVGWADAHAVDLAAARPVSVGAAAPDAAAASAPSPAAPVEVPTGHVAVTAPLAGTVVSVAAAPGHQVAAGDELLVVEAMKMEHEVRAPAAGLVRTVPVAVGATVDAGAVLVVLAESGAEVITPVPDGDVPLDHVRPDLAEAQERHEIGLDRGRPEVTERRHAAGRRTARENIADLADPGSFTEYGALTIAAQRRRRSLDDLIARSPADGLVMGTATVDGRPVAVMSYDDSEMAGTQGIMNHRKTDRLLELAARERLPLVMFTEGGGGRPGDTDTTAVAQLDVPTFRLAAQLAGQVPLVAVVSGYCFAGNAALAGACDVIIATPEASLGMGGPAMIEGGGLGVVAPDQVGPMTVQVPNGVVDLLVEDEAAAVRAARSYLSYLGAPVTAAGAPHADQRLLRQLIPENRVRSYDVRPVVETLCDTGSVLELRAEFGIGVLTALARIDGRAVGLLASNPRHLGGAIDGDAADKAAAFLRLCQAHQLPVVSIVDTPGFMVGPEVERTAVVRRFGAMFVAGAQLTVPVCAVVLRKAYGLGAMAMTAGDLRRPAVTVAWPTGEFGGMGLEGAVRLGYRKELNAISDPAARRARYDELVAGHYARGRALSTAAAFEIDDVIDPADTRAVLTATLSRSAPRR
jgi:acetyl/propionyl-CoA carboxylase alpha subunit/acetyl-CoA carboxylase carboxyltransferase component